MAVDVPPLPYAHDALAPALSARAVQVHYEQHHKGYLRKLQAMVQGTPDADRDLLDLVQGASGALLNNAAQIYNHTFFWESMKPGGGGAPAGELGALIERDFGSYDAFRGTFIDTGVKHFASGWLWLVVHRGRLRVVTTPNALAPVMTNTPALLAADLWEHAYYIDYEHRRQAFLEAYCDQLIDWDRAAQRLQGVPTSRLDLDDTIIQPPR